jgi:apolipoprotein N-acyltransferase
LIIAMGMGSWNSRKAISLGALFALGTIIPTLIVTELPWSLASALAMFLVITLGCASLVLRLLIRKRDFNGAFSIGLFLTVTEWVTTHALPVFGAAQTTLRSWSFYPWSASFTAFAGVGGLAFATGFTAALFAFFVVGPSRKRFGVGLLVWICCLGAWPLLVRETGMIPPPMSQKMTVAAIGINKPSGDIYEKAIRQASHAGARLAVLSETCIRIGTSEYREQVRGILGAMAAGYKIGLVVGVWDTPTQTNQAWLFTPDGKFSGEYLKANLITGKEQYTAGSGTPVTMTIDGVRIGVMICQDDNFTELSRLYGRMGVGIVAVPSNDWPGVSGVHLDSALMRGQESGYVVVRGVSNGICAVADGQQRATAPKFSWENPFTLLVTTVSPGTGNTPYSFLGDVFSLGCAIILTGYLIRIFISRPKVPAPPHTPSPLHV